jgi:uncharacterized protein
MVKPKSKKLKNTFSWMNPKLEVRNTEKCGKGVFAKKDIKKDELLAVFGGYILTLKEEEVLPKKFCDHGVQISEEFVLTVKKMSEIEDAGYFNHSCDPNAGYKGQIFLVAMKKIRCNEEVTFDYAMVLCHSKNAEIYTKECLCGSKNCRKIISEDDWKKQSLQKKYDGYFQWYLQEKINKIKNKK